MNSNTYHKVKEIFTKKYVSKQKTQTQKAMQSSFLSKTGKSQEPSRVGHHHLSHTSGEVPQSRENIRGEKDRGREN